MRSGIGIIASAGGAAAGVDVLEEPFTNLSAWTVSGNPAITASGRNGNGVLISSTAGNNARYAIADVHESDQVTIGCAWRTNTTSASSRDVFALYSDDGATVHTRVVYNGTTQQSFSVSRATTALGTTATGLIAVNTWCYIELKCRLHDTLGSAVLRINGTEVLNLTGVDTKNAGTKTVYDTLELRVNSSGITNIWDDLYLSTGGAAFKGDQGDLAA